LSSEFAATAEAIVNVLARVRSPAEAFACALRQPEGFTLRVASRSPLRTLHCRPKISNYSPITMRMSGRIGIRRGMFRPKRGSVANIAKPIMNRFMETY
jgi:hypothetical protein